MVSGKEQEMKNKMKEDDVLFLRVSTSGKGVYAFAPTTEGEQAKWMLIGNFADIKALTNGTSGIMKFTVKKVKVQEKSDNGN